MLVGVAAFITWFMFRRRPRWRAADPLRHHLLPLVGALFIMLMGGEESGEAQCPLGRAVGDADHGLPCRC